MHAGWQKSNRVINRWNQYDQGVVDVTSINAFKSKLKKLKYTGTGFSRTSPLSSRLPGEIPAGEATQDE